MTHHSPFTGNQLKQFAGNPTTIASTAEQYKTLGQAMTRTADTLKDITESQVSKGTERLKSDAEKLEGDLRKAGLRYADTGAALAPYATALETARTWYNTHHTEVEAAERRYTTASSEYTTLLYSPPVISSDESKATEAADNLSDASVELDRASTDRDTEWRAFDSVFDIWETAFETAADRVAAAMDAADNDDGKWDWIADALKIWVTRLSCSLS